jgi:hypothetical protein
MEAVSICDAYVSEIREAKQRAEGFLRSDEPQAPE